MALQKGQKTALVFLAIILLELILVAEYVPPCEGKIKKKILKKKLKKLLPLLLALKPKKKKKKIILLPLPIPMPWVENNGIHFIFPCFFIFVASC